MTNDRIGEPRRAPGGGGGRFVLSPGGRKPVPDLVEERLVELLEGGELAVGDRLPTEPDLARSFCVARSSVRTALQRLKARGILDVSRGRGWFVAAEPRIDEEAAWVAFSDADLLEVMQVRIALEGVAAALAAAQHHDGRFDDIAKINQTHREASIDDPASLLRSDKAFHEAIVEASQNRYLKFVYAHVTPLMDSWRAASFHSPEVQRRSANDHEQILWQLRRGDEVGARLAVTSHLLAQHDAIAADRARRQWESHGGREPGLTTFVDDIG